MIPPSVIHEVTHWMAIAGLADIRREVKRAMDKAHRHTQRMQRVWQGEIAQRDERIRDLLELLEEVTEPDVTRRLEMQRAREARAMEAGRR